MNDILRNIKSSTNEIVIPRAEPRALNHPVPAKAQLERQYPRALHRAGHPSAATMKQAAEPAPPSRSLPRATPRPQAKDKSHRPLPPQREQRRAPPRLPGPELVSALRFESTIAA